MTCSQCPALHSALDDLCDDSWRDNSLSWGIPVLDNVFGALHPGELVVIAGRPGMGKTTVALAVAQHVAKHGNARVTILAAQGVHEIAARLLAGLSGVDLAEIRRGVRGPDLHRRIEVAAQSLKLLPLIVEQIGSSPTTWIGFRDADSLRSPALMVIDDMGAMITDLAEPDHHVAIPSLATQLRHLATTTGAVVIVTAMITRRVERREDHRPRLGDVVGFRGIEDLADRVLLLHRPSLYDSDGEKHTEVIMAKSPIGSFSTAFLDIDFGSGRIASS